MGQTSSGWATSCHQTTNIFVLQSRQVSERCSNIHSKRLSQPNPRTTREYATFEDRGDSYVWAREEHDPNAGPDVLLNLSVSLPRNRFHKWRQLRLVGQLFLKSRGSSVVCGRVIEGRVLELYQVLTDALEETCILSAIFALRYLSRDLAANVEPIDVSFCYGWSRSCADGPSS